MNTETKTSLPVDIINFAISGCVGIVVHLLFRAITKDVLPEYGSGCISTTMQLIVTWAILQYLSSRK